MDKYVSATFIVKYFHLFLLSPYLLLVSNELNTIHKTILVYLGLFAGVYNFILLQQASSFTMSLVFLVIYLVILAQLYKRKNLKIE